MLEPNRTWYGADLFEPSEAFNSIHFECLMTEDELNMANNWISEENLK